MTDKEFRRLSRSELIDIIFELQQQLEQRKSEIQQLKQAVEKKELDISNAGSLAEAVVSINGVMEAAQAAAEEVTLPDAVATARLLMAQGTPPAAAAKQAAKGTPFSKGDIYKELIAAKDEGDREEESE